MMVRLPAAGDIKRLNDIAVRAPCTGMIIVGGGLVKHHVCNANLMRNGADFAVFINTGEESHETGGRRWVSPREAFFCAYACLGTVAIVVVVAVM